MPKAKERLYDEGRGWYERETGQDEETTAKAKLTAPIAQAAGINAGEPKMRKFSGLADQALANKEYQEALARYRAGQKTRAKQAEAVK